VESGHFLLEPGILVQGGPVHSPITHSLPDEPSQASRCKMEKLALQCDSLFPGVKYIATGYCITRRHLSASASAHSRRGGVVFTHAPFTGFTGCYSRSPRFPSSSSSLGARAPLANGAISASLQWPRASTRTRDGAPAPCDTAAPSWPATRCSASRTRRPPAPPVAPDAPGTAGSWCPGSRCPAPCR